MWQSSNRSRRSRWSRRASSNIKLDDWNIDRLLKSCTQIANKENLQQRCACYMMMFKKISKHNIYIQTIGFIHFNPKSYINSHTLPLLPISFFMFYPFCQICNISAKSCLISRKLSKKLPEYFPRWINIQKTTQSSKPSVRNHQCPPTMILRVGWSWHISFNTR